jgi:organic radical activating enzyme
MNIKDLTKTKTFCMAPWTHMHFMPNKDINPCCLSPIDRTLGNLRDQTIKEVWNSEVTKQLRLDMLNGVPRNDFCNRCYEKEEDGFTSLRTHMNDSYSQKYQTLVESTSSDGTVDKMNLVHWDFRFSNICNQRCRTCGIEFSSQWHDDYIKLWDVPKDRQPPKIKKIWNNLESFEKDFEELFDIVEYIHFAGGEPLITDEHYRVLEKLIEKKKFDVKIRYSTNFTSLKYKNYDLVEMWKHFNKIELLASLDDYGDRYNYMRKGGDWNKVIENFQRLKDAKLFDNGNIRWGIHPTISFWNIYYLPEFHSECVRLGMVDLRERQNHFSTTFHLNNLMFPDYYCCQILPKNLKEEVSIKLNNYADYCENQYKINAEGIRNLVTFMNQEDKTNLLNKMRHMSDKIDNIRNETTSEIFPFLKELFI